MWPLSWADVFTDYAQWEAAGHPDGYVWGTGWSLAYPGLTIVRDSELAREWSRRVEHSMFEVTLATDRFALRVIFHSVRTKKVADTVQIVNRLIIPLKPDADDGA